MSRNRKKASSSRALLLLCAAVVLLAVAYAALREDRVEPDTLAGSASSDAASTEGGATPPAPKAAGAQRDPSDAPGPAGSNPDSSGDPGLAEAALRVTGEPPSAGSAPFADGARIAIVIDDLGRSLDDLVRLEALGVPITYAVLPFETRTPEVVDWLRSRRREIILHLPMEPGNGANPGPGALTSAMTPAELRDATAAALRAVPGAVGVNNHMGSRLSADREAMGSILQVLAGRGLFFLDSRTSAETVAYETALGLGMPAAQRRVFLDRDSSLAAIDAEFSRLLSEARRTGAAIAIGHPYPETFEVLEQRVPEAIAAGYELVPVSFLLDDPGSGPL